MNEFTFQYGLLPKPAKTETEVPQPCSITPTSDILLRNDGFSASTAYTFDNFYAHLANILGNMERMKVDGAVLQVSRDQRTIDMLLLYDERVLLTTGDTIKGSKVRIFQRQGVPPDILHRNPNLWSYSDKLSEGFQVTFKPVYDIPLNYTLDARKSPGSDKRNLEAPAIVVAYRSRDVLEYAVTHHLNPPRNPNSLPEDLTDDLITGGIAQVMREVTHKLATIKGLTW